MGRFAIRPEQPKPTGNVTGAPPRIGNERPVAKTPAWQRKAGKNPAGGLNDLGRRSYRAQTGGTLRRPVKTGDNPRRAAFLARMGAMPGPERDSQGRPTRLLKSLQVWGASSKADARQKARAISARNAAKKRRK